MTTITTRDGTSLYYKDWGSGPAVVFSHGWRSAPTAGNRRCCSWPSTVTASLRTTAGVTVVRANPGMATT